MSATTETSADVYRAICAISVDQLAESDLRDIGADKLFSLDELGQGECMS
jgi:hypothetical protein